MRRFTHGVALIGVLLVVVMLVALASSAVAQWRADARLLANQLAFATVHHAAEAGVQRGFYELAAPPGETSWPADGTPRELRFGDARVRVTLSDEAGKIDLNLAPAALLERLFIRAALAPRQASELVEHIVARREVTPFTHIEELDDVPGMSAALYREVRLAITVHARQPGIIADAATRQVLLAVPGAEEGEVDRYLALREKHRAAELGPPLPPGEPGYFARNGNATFTVHAEARLPSGLRSHVAATVDLRRPGGKAPFRVLEWQHDGPELF